MAGWKVLPNAGIAPMAERWGEVPRVVGSNPTPGTKKKPASLVCRYLVIIEKKS
tara:strand:- start:1458 stop:1619 length:162 start_codon:yes stop_codon:yes gene_type:complete